MTLHSLPLFVRLAGRPVILIGAGEAADAKRRLLERAGAIVVGEEAAAALAIVVDDDAAAARLKARGVLVNAVDRPALCDFTLPAIVDRDPVIVAIGTGGASAGLAAALRQQLEASLPADLGDIARTLHASRDTWRARYPDAGDRRRAIAAHLRPGSDMGQGLFHIMLDSPDPDELTLRQARALADADRVTHRADVPPAILDRARADAPRVACPAPPDDDAPGLTVDVGMR